MQANGFLPMGTSWLVYLVLSIAVYVYSALALRTIARKTDTPDGWLAWVPMANVYLTARIANVPLKFATLICFGAFLFLAGMFTLLAGNIVAAVTVGMTFLDGIASVLPTLLVALSAIGILTSLFFIILAILFSIVFINSYLNPSGFGNAFFLSPKISFGSVVAGLFASDPFLAISVTAGLIAYIVILPVHVFLWWKISKAREKPGWLALLMTIPVVNLIVMGIIAWKD